MTLAIGVLVLAIACTAWLTAAGTAVRSVSRMWLRHWAEQRLGGPAVAGGYVTSSQRLLVTARASTAALVTFCGPLVGTARITPGWRFAAAFVALAIAVLVFGQLVPRAIARRWAPRLVPVLLPPLELAAVPVAPLARWIRGVAYGRRRRDGTQAPGLARDGIGDLLREGELEGIGEPDENRIIAGVVHFGEKVARDVMTPRTAVVAIDAALLPADAARVISRSGFSRLPVYRGSRRRIIGMVHALDLFKTGTDAFPPVREVLYARASASCGDILFEMLNDRRHLAVVVDDSGLMIGIVTLEDLLGELVGGIHDEQDPAATDLAGASAGPLHRAR